ncbi:hypothetical protein [uncultured Mucilaginibacter sp.]|uniref:hypothetical protein n=1 Tax=uncultured Mucilaginibacter sp. TaxID=797541 RepID=UPI0025DDA87D|nr:hypothetical protein [uncultured Mucilaginibacter sp.]
MAEYFDISLIIKKTNTSKAVVGHYLARYGLSEGQNDSEYFSGNKVILSTIDDEELDFHEIVISLSEYIFHKETFEIELSYLTRFINKCFEDCNDIVFALCSYELNGYLLAGIKKLSGITEELLCKFPICYLRQDKDKHPYLKLNLIAQEIW